MLGDIRVVDFSRYIAGPYCASILGDLGADVVRVEPVGGGDDRRLVPVSARGEGALFLQLNRNKRSLAIDSAAPGGRAVVERLVAKADIAVTNMPPRALKRYGLDYETLRRIRPDIITVNLSAFGTKGRLSGQTGFDAVAQAMSGAAYLGGRVGRPSRSASSYVDYGTGLAGAMGALAAIVHRLKTGEGQDVQASLLATGLAFLNAMHIEQAARQLDRKPYGNRSPNSGPSDFCPTKDGVIAVQVVGNVMFKRWAALVGKPDLPKDRRFATDAARGRNGAALSRMLRDWAKSYTSAEAIDLLAREGIPAGPVYTPRQTLADPGIAEAGVFQMTDFPGVANAIPLVGLPVQLQSLSQAIRMRAPLPGEHSEAVLRELGYGVDEIAAMVREGCVGCPAE